MIDNKFSANICKYAIVNFTDNNTGAKKICENKKAISIKAVFGASPNYN